MSSPLKVLAIVGSPTTPDQLFMSALGSNRLADTLGAACGRDVEVSLLSWLPAADPAQFTATHSLAASDPGPIDRILRRIGMPRIDAVLRRTPPGRLILSLGPSDPSRVFWRAVQADPQAMALLAGADVVLAVDLPGVRTAWNALRAQLVEHAYYGIASTVKVFATRFSQ